MTFLNHNGNILSEINPVAGAHQGGLRYGHGAFETIRISKGLPIHFSLHVERLRRAISCLQLNCSDPDNFYTSLLQQSLQLIEMNQVENGILRIQVFAAGKSLASFEMEYIIQSSEEAIPFNSSLIRLTFYEAVLKTADHISHLKHCNYLPYILAGHHAHSKGCEDALLFNQFGRVCESARANLFIIRKGEIHTPPISEGCIDGITRSLLIQQLHTLGWKVHEIPIERTYLLDSEEIFLTNSLRGIMRVNYLEDKALKHAVTDSIIEAVQGL